jgi:hypothetical protein
MPTPQVTLTPLQLVTPVLAVGSGTLSIDSTVLPIILNADENTARIEISAYGALTVLTTPTVVSGENQYSTSIAVVPTVQETSVSIVGRNYNPAGRWTPLTQFAVGYTFIDNNGYVESVITAGESGTGPNQPAFPAVAPAVITNVSLTSNVVTIIANNTFSIGQTVLLTGLTNAAFLNNQALVVVSASGTQFTAGFLHNDYPATSDTGKASATTADGSVVWANLGVSAITPTIQFNLLFFASGLATIIGPPTGLQAFKNQTDCLLQWVTPNFNGFVGVRVMISTDPAGINPPFTQYGGLIGDVSSTSTVVIAENTTTTNTVPTALITQVAVSNNILTITANSTFSQGTVVTLAGLTNATFLNGQTVTISSATSTQFVASFVYSGTYPATADTGVASSVVSTTIVTNTQTVENVSYSTVDIPLTAVNADEFYAMFSTVIQDPGTNAVYESIQNGPLTCGFVNLKVVSPTDFLALQKKEDIAGRMIGQIMRQRPTLDLSPRSEVRDVVVDPPSIEMSNMSVREWFARVSQSISAISQIDDTTGTGVSDPFQQSPYKQQIARAYGLSAADTQSLIDEQFNILGEQAGLTRGAATPSSVVLTFYTYQQPQASITIPQGAVVATIADQNTPSLNFTTLGQGTISINNLNSFYDSTTGYWAVSVPAQCNSTGSITNVGAGTILQVVSNVPSGMNVTNLTAAQYGTDQQSNASYAAMIQARLVTGVDTGTRHGYLVTALGTPGVVSASVVAAGDLEMLRDWDDVRQKHVYGCVDIYVQGISFSQQNQLVAFEYDNTGTYGQVATYLPLTLPNSSQLKFQITNFNALQFPLYDAVELIVSRASNSFYLGLQRAQFDNVNGYIIVNQNDLAYQYVGSAITQAQVPLLINNVPATNLQAIASLQGAQSNTYSFALYARYASPLTNVPSLQPVLQVYSVTGEANETGAVPSSAIELIHTSDFLLEGGSNQAGDTVQVNIVSQPTTATITALSANPAEIDTAMDVPIDLNGNPQNILSVRSTDLFTLYEFGVDYSIAATGPYHTYGLNLLTKSVPLSAVAIVNNVAYITATSDFGVNAPIVLSGMSQALFLNTQTITVASNNGSQFTGVYVNPNYGSDIQTVAIAGNILTVTSVANNLTPGTAIIFSGLTNAAFLNGVQLNVQSATPTSFTANYTYTGSYGPTADTGIASIVQSGLATGSAIQNNQQVVVAYNKFVLYERLEFISGETQVLNGTLPTTLDNTGFVRNTWLPLSYGNTTLTLDGWDGLYGPDGGLDVVGSTGLVGAAIPLASRYIKVTYFNGVTNVVKREGIDFSLSVDPVSGQAQITRILTGSIPDGGTVTVSYFITETFTLSTQYPTFVEVLANQIAQTKHAAANVLVKNMVANPVDITMTVTLMPNADAATVDPIIRTVISIVLDNAQGTLYQSALIRQVQAVTGVQSITLPLTKCAKSDGSYDIGFVIPTQTAWIPVTSDPAFAGLQAPAQSFITVLPVLPDSTIPSGGEPDAVVNLLYQGQSFRRATSVNDFLTNSIGVPSFYIIGENDEISPSQGLTFAYAQKVMITLPPIPDFPTASNPGQLSFFVTYQVFNEGGAKDIAVSSTEYLTPGTITINYITSQ